MRTRNVFLGNFDALRACLWSMIAVAMGICFPVQLTAQASNNGVTITESPDSVTLRFLDADIRSALLAIGRFIDRPLHIGAGVTGRLLLDSPRPVAKANVLRLLRGVVEAQGLLFVDDSIGGVYRVQAKEPIVPTTSGAAPRASSETVELFVIKLRHARAVDVAATVNALYGRASAFGEIGNRPRGNGPTLGQQLSTQPPSQQQAAQAPLTGAPSSITGGRAAQFQGEVTIVPDGNSNTLLVRAGQGDFALVESAVRQLDVRPLQALIEVIIAEVRTDRSFDFGIEAQLKDNRSQATGLTGAQKGVGLGDFALRVMHMGAGLDLDATLRASAARGDAKIISRPVVLAANGETAEILVGSQRPFVQVQRSLPTDTPTRDQVVQYKDVGTRLSVQPTISSDGYLSLAVTQEVNAATSETQFDAPIISTRTVQTILLVRDSQVVVLGGLNDVQREASQSGIPVLSSIPLLGGLFGRASRRTTETEFFLFIRPRIIRTDEDAERLTNPYENRAKRAGPELQDATKPPTH